MNSKSRLSIQVVISAFLIAASLTACSKSSSPEPSNIGTYNGGDPTSIPAGKAGIVTDESGKPQMIHNRNGAFYIEVDATFSPAAFERLNGGADRSRYNDAIKSTLQALKDVGAIPLIVKNEVGFFNFLLPYHRVDSLSAVKGARFTAAGMLVSPSSYDVNALKAVRDHTAAAMGLVSAMSPSINGRASDDAFSGLNRIGAVEFVSQVEAAIGAGAKVDGSSVKLGITDTGITYNHPTFLAGDLTTNRIQYMRDFTREGRAYFNVNATFVVAPDPAGGPSDFLVTGQAITGVVTPALPNGDQFDPIASFPIKVSDTLKAELLANPNAFRMAFIDEAALQSTGAEAAVIDMNVNGKLDDKFPVLLEMGATPQQDKIYVDFSGQSGKGDFSNVVAIHDFNSSKETTPVFMEKVGFDVRDDQLPPSTGTDPVNVRSISFVGFDAGNHGTHVAGIAAGRKTIQNDPDDTLARGVAPNAQIFQDRVCANNGGCNATTAMIDLATNAGVDVINMSLGGLSPFNDGYGVQETVLNRLTSIKNVLFVVSAGNDGPGRQTIGSPSTARLALSIGASASKGQIQRQYGLPGNGGNSTDENDEFMLFFSSRGPTASGGFKPNVVAPGTELSSVALNQAAGNNSGLDVYWGTSMAAPTTTGAYALLLDGVKKYNAKFPAQALPTDVITLRSVLIASARPFSMGSYDPSTGVSTDGEYSWVDEGTGLIDLPAAWAKLIAVRDSALPTGVKDSQGKDVSLDYNILTSIKNPQTGALYDGSRAWQDDQGAKQPAFGTGLYLDYYSTETLRSVLIERRLAEKYAASPELASLSTQLATTAETFVLKTKFYGPSAKEWLKAGVLNQVDCANSPTSDLRLIGRASEVTVNADGTGDFAGIPGSYLMVCLNRDMISNQLAPGDHGALIEAYRKVGDKVSAIPSFIVPVYVTVPHQTLANSTAYEISGQVGSFGIRHNYVTIPKGTTIAKITISVPPYSAQEGCSAVDLMDLEGSNQVKATETADKLRVGNCKTNGAPVTDPAQLQIVLNRVKPLPGIWDLNIFGDYKFPSSKYKIRVDYVVATTSVPAIVGDPSALTGSFGYQVAEASMQVAPDPVQSRFVMGGLTNTVQGQVSQDATVVVASKLGALRSYPAGTQAVQIKTGNSDGNDIDIAVVECASATDDPSAPGLCAPVAQSAGPDANESVTFVPAAGKFYALLATGYDIKDAGNFLTSELIVLQSELGQLTITGSGTGYTISYSFSTTGSALFSNPLYTSGTCDVAGTVLLKSSDGLALAAIPVQIKAPAPQPNP